MICLLYGHTPIYALSKGWNDPVLYFMENSKCVYSLFFMQSFFLFTGFCSSFSIGFWTYLWRNIKTLLIPAISLTLIAAYINCIIYGDKFCTQPFYDIIQWFYAIGPWFIMVLFICKIIYWFINKLNYGFQTLILFTLFLIGIFLTIKSTSTEYLWHQHVLLMVPFIAIGNMLKTYYCSIKKYIKPIAILGFFFIPIECFIAWKYKVSLPIIDAGICIPYYFAPLHFFNVGIGTALIVTIAKRLTSQKWLSDIGTYSLLFYLWNGFIHFKILYLLTPLYYKDNIFYCTLLHIFSLILCVMTSYIISYVIYKKKYLKWIVGKW